MIATDTAAPVQLDLEQHEALNAKLRAALDALRQLPAAAIAASAAVMVQASPASFEALALQASHALTVLRTIATGEAPAGPRTVEDLELQVKRLDIEEHDILVLRTAKKLTEDEAHAAAEMVEAIAARTGFRNVTPLILDNCSDLSIERPQTAMAHQRPRDLPQSMG